MWTLIYLLKWVDLVSLEITQKFYILWYINSHISYLPYLKFIIYLNVSTFLLNHKIRFNVNTISTSVLPWTHTTYQRDTFDHVLDMGAHSADSSQLLSVAKPLVYSDSLLALFLEYNAHVTEVANQFPSRSCHGYDTGAYRDIHCWMEQEESSKFRILCRMYTLYTLGPSNILRIPKELSLKWHAVSVPIYHLHICMWHMTLCMYIFNCYAQVWLGL